MTFHQPRTLKPATNNLPSISHHQNSSKNSPPTTFTSKKAKPIIALNRSNKEDPDKKKWTVLPPWTAEQAARPERALERRDGILLAAMAPDKLRMDEESHTKVGRRWGVWECKQKVTSWVYIYYISMVKMCVIYTRRFSPLWYHIWEHIISLDLIRYHQIY